jgi:hypothetical protein
MEIPPWKEGADKCSNYALYKVMNLLFRASFVNAAR